MRRHFLAKFNYFDYFIDRFLVFFTYNLYTSTLRGLIMKNLLFIMLLLMSSVSIAGGCGGDHEHDHEKKEKTEHDQGTSEEA